MATVTIHSDFLAQENKICQSYRSIEALPTYYDASIWLLSGILYLFKFVVYSVFNPAFTAFCTLTKAAKPGVSEQGSGARLSDSKPRPAHASSISSVQFGRSVVSDSLRPHELWDARLPCPSLTTRECSNSCPSSQWCHPTISSSVIPFSCPNSFQHHSVFQWVNSSHEVAKVLEFQPLASVLPKNTQDWSHLEWTGWISLQSKRLSRVFSNTTVQKHQFFGAQLSL